MHSEIITLRNDRGLNKAFRKQSFMQISQTRNPPSVSLKKINGKQINID